MGAIACVGNGSLYCVRPTHAYYATTELPTIMMMMMMNMCIIIVMITVAFWWWKGEHDNVFTLARAIMLQQQPPPTAPFIRHSPDLIHICSVRISDDGHGFLLAIGRDAKMRFGCIIEQKWMHVPDADADARSGCTCTSAPKFVSPGWPALVHLALCVLKWERGIKVINTFPPNHSSKAEPTQTLLSFNPT